MRYLITTKEIDTRLKEIDATLGQFQQSPFLTDWFEPENHFNSEVGMIVYDLHKNQFTTDGKIWKEIEVDHL